MQGQRLEHLTWPQAEVVLRQRRVCVLPLGAGCKEHGLHLPLNNDQTLAEYFRDQLLSIRSILALPTLTYGYYPAFIEYPGSISIGKNVLRDLVLDVARSLARHGGTRLYVLNTGISTNWALEPARQLLHAEGVRMDYLDLSGVLDDLRPRICQQLRGTHADEIETSMMLEIAPMTVRMELARRDDEPDRGPGGLTRDPQKLTGVFSPTGAWGDPTVATREKGLAAIRAVVARMVEQIDALLSDNYMPDPPRGNYLP